jgi:hypothetical protein
MTTTTEMLAALRSAFRNYATDGVPGSGEHEPNKSEIYAAHATIKSAIDLVAAAVGIGYVPFATKANLDADLAHVANTGAIVWADGTATNNAVYKKTGASGSGSWTKIIEIEDVLVSFAGAAETAADLAEQWAEEAEDVEVTTGKYSAKHHALKAETFADNAAASAASVDLPLQRASRLKSRLIAAAGSKDRISLLLTKDGTKTYRSGSTTDIETIAPLIPETGMIFRQGANSWNGLGSPATPTLPLRPVETATGLSFHRQTGFRCRDLSNNPITAMPSLSDRWYVAAVLRFPAVVATYPDVATMNADLANRKVGEVVYSGGAESVFVGTNPETGVAYAPVPEDCANILDVSSLNTGMTRGYYIRGNATFDRMFNQRLITWWDSAGSLSSRLSYINVDPLGRLTYYAFDGTVQEANLNNWGAGSDSIAYGLNNPVLFEIERDNDEILIYVNGVEVASFHTFATHTTNRFQINGVNDGSNATVPYNGQAFILDALCITNQLDYRQNLAVSNVLADEFGTPVRERCDTAYLAVFTDQSRFSGTADATTTPANPDPVSNWNFHIYGRDGARFQSTDASLAQPSREVVPNVFGIESLANSGRIGPLRRMASNVSPVATSARSLSGGVMETIEWGFAREVMRAQAMRNAHLYLVGATYGGFADESLKAEDEGQDIYTLTDSSATVTQPRTLLNRAILRIVQRARKRGQTIRPLCVFNFQGETGANTVANRPIEHVLREADLRNWFGNQISRLLDWTGPAPIMGAKAMMYDGTNGAGNAYNLIEPAINRFPKDNLFLQLENNRDTLFRYIMFGGTGNWMGRGIHYPTILVRHYGMIIGDRVRRGFFNGERVGATRITSAVIGTAGNAGKFVLTVNRRLAVDAGGRPQMPGQYKVGGLNGSGFTTNGLIFASHATGTITLSGVPADNDTVTVAGTVYTFKNTMTTANHVQIGATAAISAANLLAAINGTGTAGVNYFAGTVANLHVFAVATTTTIIRLFAILEGVPGNSVTLAKVGSNIAVSGATLAGADDTRANGTVTLAGVPSDGDTVTVGSVTYTFKTALSAANQVLIVAGNASATLNNLVLAINGFGTIANYGAGTVANPKAFAKVTQNTLVAVIHDSTPGGGDGTTALSKVGTNISVSGATLARVAGYREISGDVTFTNGTNTATILIPISGSGPKIGDIISNTGLGVLYSNFREETTRIGYYKTQAWGSLPLASSAPTIDATADAILSDYLAPSRHPIAV